MTPKSRRSSPLASSTRKTAALTVCIFISRASSLSFSSRSPFRGTCVATEGPRFENRGHAASRHLTMRKQKASNKRTRRLQRGDISEGANDVIPGFPPSVTRSPMSKTSWRHKDISPPDDTQRRDGMGRNRSRKRSETYSSLSSYFTEFSDMLTEEYRAEESEVLGRIESSLDDPLSLEAAGHALFDLYPERRGNIFSDEVYRLTKAGDATSRSEDKTNGIFHLPPDHKFSSNDVIMLSLQPSGSGDFFGPETTPTNSDAISVEARVLSTGPTYVDVALYGGSFEATFGPAPNNGSGKRGDKNMRLRADRFFSNVPYLRMVAALGAMTSLPKNNLEKEEASLDSLFRELMVSTYCYADVSNPLYMSERNCDLDHLARRIAKPPLPASSQLAAQVISHLQTNPQKMFPRFNPPQITAIAAALSRRLTLIQGPPGTGKTTVAAAIGFGFVHQCRNLNPNAKVLACAFSNIGADNLALALKSTGLNIIRVGKPSSMLESLWEDTLEAAIYKDPAARKAREDALDATSKLRLMQKQTRGSGRNDGAFGEKTARDRTTLLVKASIEASRVAATKALRKVDVIVSTSVGAADSYLLAACGIPTNQDMDDKNSKHLKPSGDSQTSRLPFAPDGGPPLTLPFVIVDEACQSVEPANLIPLTSTNSCRSLVLLGDPCQLPPTVKSDPESPLSVSLMTRLAMVLPEPVIVTAQKDTSQMDSSFLEKKATRQAFSSLHRRNKPGDASKEQGVSYRKRFKGSLLLSVQYRMHPSISAFPSAVFYDGLLSTPSALTFQRSGLLSYLQKCLPVADPNLAVRFVNVSGKNNERSGEASFHPGASPLLVDTSYRNEEEADRILTFLKTAIRASRDSSPTDIGIVSPYAAQVSLLKSKIAEDEDLQRLMRDNHSVEVKSVDGYQGRERDLILFSAVRSNRSNKIGFLKDWRRMNVALTRAKSGLVVFGDLDTLMGGDVHWRAFGNWCRGVGCVNEADPRGKEDLE